MKRTMRVVIALNCLALLILLAGCEVETPSAYIDLKEVDIVVLQQKMETGELSSEDIVQYYLEQIEVIDQRLHSIIELNPGALSIAHSLDQERAKGNVRSPLHGIPVLIKDNIETADRMLTTAGSLALVNAPMPSQDAFVVQQLRKAGAVILGKTNLSEWANFRSTRSSSGWSSRGGQTRNPYVLDRTPCGSSSGSGVAVAANLTVVAIGTETDGSVVCPSSNNGIVGIKPSLGLVSRSGIIPIAHSQDTAGPMGRSVRDAVLLLNAMVGEDSEDAITQNDVKHDDYTRFLDADSLRNKRIGVVRQYFGRNARVDSLLEEKLGLLRDAGADIVDVEIPNLRDIDGPEFEVLLYEFKYDLNRYLKNRGGAIQNLNELILFNQQQAEKVMPFFGQELLERAQAKGGLDEETYIDALATSKRLSGVEGIDAIMDELNLDALLAPSNGTSWKIDLVNGDSPTAYVSSSTLPAVSGYPSITVPAGFIQELPIGVSFFGRAFSEPTLIGIAYAFEQLNLARRPPKLIPSMEEI